MAPYYRQNIIKDCFVAINKNLSIDFRAVMNRPAPIVRRRRTVALDRHELIIMVQDPNEELVIVPLAQAVPVVQLERVGPAFQAVQIAQNVPVTPIRIANEINEANHDQQAASIVKGILVGQGGPADPHRIVKRRRSVHFGTDSFIKKEDNVHPISNHASEILPAVQSAPASPIPIANQISNECDVFAQAAGIAPVPVGRSNAAAQILAVAQSSPMPQWAPAAPKLFEQRHRLVDFFNNNAGESHDIGNRRPMPALIPLNAGAGRRIPLAEFVQQHIDRLNQSITDQQKAFPRLNDEN